MMKGSLLKAAFNYVANRWGFITWSTCLYGWYMYIMKTCRDHHSLLYYRLRINIWNLIGHAGKLSISSWLESLRLSSYYGDTQVIAGKRSGEIVVAGEKKSRKTPTNWKSIHSSMEEKVQSGTNNFTFM